LATTVLYNVCGGLAAVIPQDQNAERLWAAALLRANQKSRQSRFCIFSVLGEWI